MRRSCLLLAMLVASAPTASAAELELVNASAKAIVQVKLARVGQKKWGPDRLAEPTPAAIAPGQSRIIADIAPGSYDLRLTDQDDRDCELYRKPISKTFRLELTDALLEACTRESH